MIENFVFVFHAFMNGATVHIQPTIHPITLILHTWMRKILVHFFKISNFKPAHFSHPVRTPVGKGVKATTPKGMNYPLRFVPSSAGAFRKPRETSWCEFKNLSSLHLTSVKLIVVKCSFFISCFSFSHSVSCLCTLHAMKNSEKLCWKVIVAEIKSKGKLNSSKFSSFRKAALERGQQSPR